MPSSSIGCNNFCGFYFGFVDQKAHVVWKSERGSCSLPGAADHLSLLLPPDDLSSPPLPSSAKSQRELSARLPVFCTFLFSFFPSPFPAGVFKSRRHFRSSPVRLSHLRSFPPQILSPRSLPMDPHHSLQVPNSGGSSRGASRPVSVQPASSTSQSQSARKRASHNVQSSQQQPHQVPDDNIPTYRDVYSHPAAVAYAAAHPRRTIPKFGPYLLLQTLGEGEFGKVKLGLHMQWGEEVAVKLIRRGNIDTSARMSKVEREIEVLRVRCRSLCHLFSLFGPVETLSVVLCPLPLLGSQAP